MLDEIKISYCITCKGRLSHLKQTLPKNLNVTSINSEFVILDYDSDDGLQEWVKTTYPHEIESGKIKYVRFAPAPYFKMAHAKNMAHRMASGNVLCNLDADVFLHPDFTNFLSTVFVANINSIVRANHHAIVYKRIVHKLERGIGGLMAIGKDNFYTNRGYNEVHDIWGPDDTEFLSRAATHSNLQYTPIPPDLIGGVLPHDNEQRLKHYDPLRTAEARERLNKSRSIIGMASSIISPFTYKIRKLVPQANTDGSFGCGTVTVNFDETNPITLMSILPTQTVCTVLHSNTNLGTVPTHRKL